MKKTIDARGKLCPVPVVETNKLLKTLKLGDIVAVEVDNYIAVQNLTKMGEQKKLSVSFEEINKNHYTVTFELISALETTIDKEEDSKAQHDRPGKTLISIASNKMGQGDERLGHVLMKGFIYALTEQEALPETILLYNSGCFLSTEGSDSVADLALLESQGVEILTCGTCLNHYGLDEKLAVGDVTNMYVIVEKQVQATKIIKP